MSETRAAAVDGNVRILAVFLSPGHPMGFDAYRRVHPHVEVPRNQGILSGGCMKLFSLIHTWARINPDNSNFAEISCNLQDSFDLSLLIARLNRPLSDYSRRPGRSVGAEDRSRVGM